MFKQVVSQAEVKAAVGRINFKYVADREAGFKTEGLCVGNVLGAEIEPSVVEQNAQSVGINKPIVVSRAAGRLQQGERRSRPGGRTQRLNPQSLKRVKDGLLRFGSPV